MIMIQSAYNLPYTIKMPDNSIGATTKTSTKNNLAIMYNCIKARQTQIKQNLCHAVSAFEPENFLSTYCNMMTIC